jgi:hypothetical protein
MIVSCVFTGAALAQDKQAVTRKLSENAQKLREYSFTKRTELRVNGQTEMTRLEKVRWDIDGRQQETPMGGSGEISPELTKDVRSLSETGFAYAAPDSGNLGSFLQNKAEFWEGRGAGAGTLRIEGQGFILNTDSLEIRAKNGMPERMEAETTYLGAPITIRADYRAIPGGGPNYIARMVVDYPNKSMQLIVETFEHQYSGSVAASDIAIVPEGTELIVRLIQPLSTKVNQTGQNFEAIVDKPIEVNGRVAIPAGASVVGTLVEVKRPGRTKGVAMMTLTLVDLKTSSQQVQIQTHVLKLEAQSTKGKDAARIGAGAGVGAVIGGIAGGGSGAAKGALIGGGAGTAVTLATRGNEIELPAEQALGFVTAQLELSRTNKGEEQ